MDEPQAPAAFAAPSRDTRLSVVRLLVKAGPDGMAAGPIGDALGGVRTENPCFAEASQSA